MSHQAQPSQPPPSFQPSTESSLDPEGETSTEPPAEATVQPPTYSAADPLTDQATDLSSNTDTFEQFMKLGDEASPSNTPSNPPPSNSNNPPPASENNPPPASDNNPPPASDNNPPPASDNNPPPASDNNPPPTNDNNPPPRPPPPSNPVTFFSGLISKATTTLESTLHHAQRDISALSLDTLPPSGTAALSSVSNLVADITRPPPSFSPQAPFAALTSAPPPVDTQSLKPLYAAEQSLLHLVLEGGDVVVVSHVALHRFPWEGGRCVVHPFNITWSSDGAHAVSTPVPPGGASVSRPQNLGKPVRALSAVFVKGEDEVVVGHEDGALRIYSVRRERFGVVVRTGVAEEGMPMAMCLLEGRPRRVLVGYSDGGIRVAGLADLMTVAMLMPPEICVGGFGGRVGYAGVSCVAGGKSLVGKEQGGIVVWGAFEDGGVGGGDLEGAEVGKAFVAQGRRVRGLVTFFGGVVLLTVGNETDPSVGLFDALTGRCFVRRMLPYVPSCVTRVERGRERNIEEGVCASEFALIVGGEEGQVEIFRVVVLSARKTELRLVRRISERVRGRDRGIVNLSYLRDQEVLMALSKNGELRRWRLTGMDASSLAVTAREESVRVTYTEENVGELMSRGFVTDEDSRLSSVGGVMHAQNVLASILDEESIPETNKDHLVAEFQKQQTDMLMKISQTDTELRRASKRISARFAAGLTPVPTVCSPTEQRLSRAAKRTAAFEMEFATRRHAETQKSIQVTALAKLRSLLLNSLKGMRTENPSALDEIRRNAERLGSGEAVRES